ncbi:tryptophanyl-tRNA synthetase [Salinarchaeum sp. Harcht-Bsk1]|uniref:hypothetical protein n=1 Tax=Salinarchaeum sp. Harcht-Bsk1 TaxID=1333523 RepID=UPI00034239D2|nr:hypothetical protein [Salinarchaeum sp. Harcht-Bsk1]AGN01579.1 tryptophanyl-tRNA synthetase [Salinarchaeum sp. Harcht-Bsk1]
MSRLATHYEALRERFGNGRIDRDSAPHWLGPLRRRFVAADGASVLESALDRPTLATMGVGMTGPPHLGTVGQLLTAIELQEAGLDVQFVLADLEPYHGGGDIERIGRLAERYRAFALDLGFDPERGTLRTQSEATNAMATGHRIARYYPTEQGDAGADRPRTDWERAVDAAYEAAPGDDAPAPTSAAADAHSSVLHGADFLHPLVEGNYEQLLLVFGADESDLLPWARSFRDDAGISGRIGGLFTRMVPGFEGVPKQSKSTDAGVSLAEAPAAIHERIAAVRDSADPTDSTVFQSMCLASRYDAERLDALAERYEAGGEAWEAARREYAEYVAGLAERWHATAT